MRCSPDTLNDLRPVATTSVKKIAAAFRRSVSKCCNSHFMLCSASLSFETLSQHKLAMKDERSASTCFKSSKIFGTDATPCGLVLPGSFRKLTANEAMLGKSDAPRTPPIFFKAGGSSPTRSTMLAKRTILETL